jgi:hypothetical protein
VSGSPQIIIAQPPKHEAAPFICHPIVTLPSGTVTDPVMKRGRWRRQERHHRADLYRFADAPQRGRGSALR